MAVLAELYESRCVGRVYGADGMVVLRAAA